MGQFGWEMTKEDSVLDFARVVQLGLAIGPADMSKGFEVKRILVKPSSFTITDDATKFHGITHDYACQHGTPLAQALMEFFQVVEAAYKDGGRLCAHHIEFDAGIILSELRTCGLDEQAAKWQRMARQGFCTMNSTLGRWVLTQAGEQVQENETARHFLGLAKISRMLQVPECEVLLAQHHDAGTDAKLTSLVYASLLRQHAQRSEGVSP